MKEPHCSDQLKPAKIQSAGIHSFICFHEQFKGDIWRWPSALVWADSSRVREGWGGEAKASSHMFRFSLSSESEHRQVSWPVRPCGGAVGSLETEPELGRIRQQETAEN